MNREPTEAPLTATDTIPHRYPASWYPLCRSTELRRGQVRKCRAFGQVWAVFRTTQGRVSAISATCIHMGADLARGKVVGDHLQCPLHEWEFGADGGCARIPAVTAGTEPAIPPRARQTALVCEEHYGMVMGFFGGPPTFPFPQFVASDHDLYSSAYSMAFDTPYQVLAANSFDSQHFSTVHHRALLAPPALSSTAPHHLCVEFRATVEGDHFHDRALRALGVKVVELSAHCWGGNNILAYNARTNARILFTILPIEPNRTRVYILNVMPSQTAPSLPRPLRRLIVGLMHQMTIAFLKADIAVMRDLQFKLGVLLPEADQVFIEWLKYWRALPPATQKG